MNSAINYVRTLDNGILGNITFTKTNDTTTGYNIISIDPNYPYNQTITVPSYPNDIRYYNYISSEPTYVIKVEKCENGFIVHKNGQKFVVTKPEDIAKYLKDGNGTK